MLLDRGSIVLLLLNTHLRTRPGIPCQVCFPARGVKAKFDTKQVLRHLFEGTGHSGAARIGPATECVQNWKGTRPPSTVTGPW